MSINVEDGELGRLLDTIHQQYGYDYRQYAAAHIKRRITNHMNLAGYADIEALRDRVIHDPGSAATLLQELSITVTEMFRDPDLYLTLREKVVPLLRTWSHIRIWHAGCSTGEEVYSMAILLKEEGLYDRARIYATDVNKEALEKAEEGIYPLEAARNYARNYQRSGAKGSFSDHCLAKYGSVIMDGSLKKNIVWADHNLVTDSDFTEVQMVMCRNVLIYFNRELQQRVHRTFLRSLVNGGLLCLGAKETIDNSGVQENYTVLDKRNRIYRKKYPAT